MGMFAKQIGGNQRSKFEIPFKLNYPPWKCFFFNFVNFGQVLQIGQVGQNGFGVGVGVGSGVGVVVGVRCRPTWIVVDNVDAGQ